jgi:hypothetical protein
MKYVVGQHREGPLAHPCSQAVAALGYQRFTSLQLASHFSRGCVCLEPGISPHGVGVLRASDLAVDNQPCRTGKAARQLLFITARRPNESHRSPCMALGVVALERPRLGGPEVQCPTCLRGLSRRLSGPLLPGGKHPVKPGAAPFAAVSRSAGSEAVDRSNRQTWTRPATCSKRPIHCALLGTEGAERGAMAEIPTGTVTSLLADIEGLTSLWQQNEAAMRARQWHDELLHRVVVEGGCCSPPWATGWPNRRPFAGQPDATNRSTVRRAGAPS